VTFPILVVEIAF